MILAFAPASADDLPRVADCTKPVYSLDHYDDDKELMLDLAIKDYRECVLHVADTHEQSDSGSSYEIRFAERALERIDLDLQAVWPRTEIIDAAKNRGLWTEDQTAAAVSIRNQNGNQVYVLLEQAEGGFLVVDISPIELGLVAKLGMLDKSEYERLDIEPDEWLSKAEDYFLLRVRLEAWREGRRSTVAGPVVIKFDGTIVWQ